MVQGWQAAQQDVDALVGARHQDPFSVLGVHDVGGSVVVRALVPGAEELAIVPDGGKAALFFASRRDDAGFFEALVPEAARPQKGGRLRYMLKARRGGDEWMLRDPYCFAPVLGPMDDYLLVEGTHRRLYERLGAHPIEHEGVAGVAFAVWAPNARRVSVVGDFNAWDGRRHQMRKRIDSGIWELFAPDVGEGTAYKYEIHSAGGQTLPLKADPFGFGGELRPSSASIVARTDRFSWNDAAYMAARGAGEAHRRPMSALEVHLGSWMRAEDNRFLTYDELADKLVPYAVEMGFTHLELLPISEHPLDDSWGYQPIGLFAPTARFGSPAGFQRFVDRAHQAGLAIILDWVPAHFPIDAQGLAWFDGQPLYEYADPRKGFHPDWNTAIYDFARREVANVLAANALYWLDRFHIDGLRVDAVASMIYLDYSRRDGEWLPNADGGNDNREAVAFLRQVNQLVYAGFPGAVTIAEESTAWPKVSRPVHDGGLGFGFKWNMGWMHDTLHYMQKDPVHRRWHHDKMTFGLLYAFSENFVLALSHDEVVHGKGSMIGKMPGDYWQKFANLRAYYGFMWGHPGKKLLFMGQEFGQFAEWNFNQSLDWHLLAYDKHDGLKSLVRDLNRTYVKENALHSRDSDPSGFQWLVVNDYEQSVFAFLRHGEEGAPPILVVCNFTPEPRFDYRVGLPFGGHWREIINTDAEIYGGSGRGNLGAVVADGVPAHGQPTSATFVLPPLSCMWFRHGLGGP